MVRLYCEEQQLTVMLRFPSQLPCMNYQPVSLHLFILFLLESVFNAVYSNGEPKYAYQMRSDYHGTTVSSNGHLDLSYLGKLNIFFWEHQGWRLPSKGI